jgi:hypothetical protein
LPLDEPPLPPVPPPDWVPELGVCPDGGVTVPPLAGVPVPDGVPELGVPPPDPPIDAPPPFCAFLFFFLSPGCTGLPPVTGGVIGWTVWLELEPPPPPPLLDAIAITTIRKKTTPTSATSRRRR